MLNRANRNRYDNCPECMSLIPADDSYCWVCDQATDEPVVEIIANKVVGVVEIVGVLGIVAILMLSLSLNSNAKPRCPNGSVEVLFTNCKGY